MRAWWWLLSTGAILGCANRGPLFLPGYTALEAQSPFIAGDTAHAVLEAALAQLPAPSGAPDSLGATPAVRRYLATWVHGTGAEPRRAPAHERRWLAGLQARGAVAGLAEPRRGWPEGAWAEGAYRVLLGKPRRLAADTVVLAAALGGNVGPCSGWHQDYVLRLAVAAGRWQVVEERPGMVGDFVCLDEARRPDA